MHCPACQAENPEQARFCMVCATPMRADEPHEAAAPPAPTTAAATKQDTEDLTFGGPTIAPAKHPAAAPMPTVEAPGPTSDLEGSMSGGQTLAGAQDTSSGRTSDDLAPGMRMGAAERYELIDKIGQGGMGSVWRAKDLSLDGRVVAMKRLLVFDEADRRMLERFEQERRTIAGLNHANVVTVHDAGSDDWGPYLVMEFVEGEPLDKLLKRETLDEERAVTIFEGLVRGVAHAHKKGVIHRDIKPANVILDGDGTPKLLDFGLARGAAGLELSMTGYGMGTLDYAAPEQKRDAKSVDHRADIYALGATFYELLTGLKPVPLLVAKIPARWQALLGRCCEPDPAERYQAATEVLASIDEARNTSTIEAPAPAGPDEDDLSCPSCRRTNAPDARFCRSCGEGLQTACPACKADCRVGVRHCDKCGANIEAIQEGKARLEAAQEALEGTRLGVAQREAAAGLEAIEGARLGGANSLEGALQNVARQARVSEQEAGALLEEADRLEHQEKYEEALEKLREAAAQYNSLASQAADAESHYSDLIRTRDGKCRLAQAQSKEECEEYEAALSLYAEAAQLDEQHEAAWERAQVVLPLWISLSAATEKIEESVRKTAAGNYEEAARSLDLGIALVPTERVLSLASKLESADTLGLSKSASDVLDRAMISEQRLAPLQAEADQSIAGIKQALEGGNLESTRELLCQVGPWKSFDKRAQELNKEYKSRVERRDQAYNRIRRNTNNPLFLLIGSFIPSNHRELKSMTGRGGDLKKKANSLLLKLRIARTGLLAGIFVITGLALSSRWTEWKYERAKETLLVMVKGADTLDALSALKTKWGNSDVWPQVQDEATTRTASLLTMAVREVSSLDDLAALEEKWNSTEAWPQVRDEITTRSTGLLIADVRDVGSLDDLIALEKRWHSSEAWSQVQNAATIRAASLLSMAIRGATSFSDLAALEAKWSNSDAWPKVRDISTTRTASLLNGAIQEASSLYDLAAIKTKWGSTDAWPQIQSTATTHISGLLSMAILEASSFDDLSALSMQWAPSSAWKFVRDEYRDKALSMVDARSAAGHPLTEEMVNVLLAAGRALTQTTSNGIELLAVPAGQFQMGSDSGASDEKPVHLVTVMQAFFLGRTEVTQAQWMSIMGSNPADHTGDNLPVEQVSWTDCTNFCKKLTARDHQNGKLPDGWEYALPTEAQWEYACRSGNTGKWCFGSDEGKLVQYGWYSPNSEDQTHPIGQKKANKWGFQDMHGNVWEWCRDWYDSGFYGMSGARRDPFNSSSTSNRVRRGGSFGVVAGALRSANRYDCGPHIRRENLGFRLAMVATE